MLESMGWWVGGWAFLPDLGEGEGLVGNESEASPIDLAGPGLVACLEFCLGRWVGGWVNVCIEFFFSHCLT